MTKVAENQIINDRFLAVVLHPSLQNRELFFLLRHDVVHADLRSSTTLLTRVFPCYAYGFVIHDAKH